MRKFRFLILVALIFLLNTQAKIIPSTSEGIIAKVVQNRMEYLHYDHKKFDDDMSKLLVEEYFKALDPQKCYFYQSDIDSFAVYNTELDDQIFNGNVDFAFDVFDLFQKRINERVEYAEKRLEKPFDFTKEETMPVSRKDSSYFKTEEEMNEFWRKKVKASLLTYVIIDESMKRKEEEGELTDTDKKFLKNTELLYSKPPKERALKIYKRFSKKFEDYDTNDVLELYLATLTRLYDPHSTYMSGKSLEDFTIQMSLSLQGIGATLTTDDGFAKIVKVVAGGPAAKDGRLKEGDLIIAVGNEGDEPVDIIDMELDKAVTYIRGEKGSKVVLTVIDGDKGLGSKPYNITLTRDEIKLEESAAKGEVKSFEKDGKEYKLGILSIPSFYADFKGLNSHEEGAKSLTNDLINIITEMNNQDIDGLVVDLRANGGGSLEEAVNSTGLFFPEGPVVQISSGGLFPKKIREDSDPDMLYKGPMVVMVNGLSASASEIFAGAIQDYNRGIVVGDTKTHGKGTVQTMYDLNRITRFKELKDRNSGALKLTIQKFYRITGKSTQKEGVRSDITFPSFTDKMEVFEDDLPYHMKYTEIEPTEVNYDFGIAKYRNILAEKSYSRQSSDSSFISLKEEIAKFEKELNKKEVSLNLDKRLEQTEENEESAKLRRKLYLGTNDRSSTDDNIENEEDELEDIYLTESFNILTDLIELQK